MKVIYQWSLLVLFTAISNLALAVKAPKIEVVWVTESWPEYTDTDGTGLYHELLAQIFSQSPYQLTVNYLPWKRALNQITIKQAQISGALPINNDYLFANVPILTQPISVLTQKDTKDLSLEKLKNLVGIWPVNYVNELMQPEVKPFINGITASNRADALKLLTLNKVDYYLDIRPMIEAQLATLPANIRNNFHIKDYSTLNLYMIFSNDEKGRALRDYYQRQTKHLWSQGVLQPIYEKYHISLPSIE